MSQAPNAAQVEYWNEVAGPTWAELQDELDGMISPMGMASITALAPAPGEAILDVGCGCGRTSWYLADAVGRSGRIVGVDISAPMLVVARSCPAREGLNAPRFVEADVQTADLGHGAFDAAYSRFGVMFFADPAAAFANIRGALRSGGRLAFVCWRDLTENLWLRAPLEAAMPFLPPQPPPDPFLPGPFAFADPDRVRQTLGEAGFEAVKIEAFDAGICQPDLDRAVAMTFRVGPLSRVIRENPHLKGEVEGAVRAAMSRFVTAEGVRAPGAAWIVTARVA